MVDLAMVQRRLIVLVVVLVGLAAPRWLRSVDCNLNRIEDADDITAGVSEDCNGDGPEPSAGCGSDPTPDELGCAEFSRCL